MTDTTQAAPPTVTLAALGDLPDDFTLESLQETLTEAEIAALQIGDDALIVPVPPDETPADEPPAPQVETPPVQMAPPPDTREAEAIVQAANAKLDDLMEQYDNGELTRDEWREQQRAIIAQQAAAQAQINEAQRVITQNATQTREAWFSAVDAYQSQHDYLGQPEHFDAWDSALKSVNSTAAYRNLPAERRIELAHGLYAQHYRAVTGNDLPSQPGAKAAAAKQADPAAPQRRTDPRPDAPVTLAQFSAAAENDLDNGTLAAILREKDPLKAEAMLAAAGDDILP